MWLQYEQTYTHTANWISVLVYLELKSSHQNLISGCLRWQQHQLQERLRFLGYSMWKYGNVKFSKAKFSPSPEAYFKLGTQTIPVNEWILNCSCQAIRTSCEDGHTSSRVIDLRNCYIESTLTVYRIVFQFLHTLTPWSMVIVYPHWNHRCQRVNDYWISY